MYLQWSGILSCIILIFFCALILGGILLLRYLYQNLFNQKKDPYLRKLINASLFMMSYTLILVGVNQAISLDIIVFTSETNELLFRMISGAVTVLVGIYSLCFIVNKIKLIQERDKKEP